ncbi:hypothetical protein F5J12DRAFT_342517 [Pisolithus orientalis]|uniref:uncharacterized protein n=1 Tax=Pisolithus orientalis TaxID=936130 RepID=UPI002224F7B1|nr:uncharacterized protein F5J12DRAFT_342517 [Pisolithus orientalis]KAI5997294.1 hypothetical protein F5J12DRAFT_342517 [Pisolithus orientalis]
MGIKPLHHTTRCRLLTFFGIFKVHLPVLYGEPVENALGRLLAEFISRSGDVSVLDWVGEASSFNSCFSANLVPYQAVPYLHLVSNDSARRDDLDLEKAQKLYSNFARSPRTGFVSSKVVLPSTAHPLQPQQSDCKGPRLVPHATHTKFMHRAFCPSRPHCRSTLTRVSMDTFLFVLGTHERSKRRPVAMTMLYGSYWNS